VSTRKGNLRRTLTVQATCAAAGTTFGPTNPNTQSCFSFKKLFIVSAIMLLGWSRGRGKRARFVLVFYFSLHLYDWPSDCCHILVPCIYSRWISPENRSPAVLQFASTVFSTVFVNKPDVPLTCIYVPRTFAFGIRAAKWMRLKWNEYRGLKI
jgi:hypothetical protein